MPGTFEAALVFAFAVVPGYVLLQGFEAGRSEERVQPGPNLYVLAEAFVLSLAWLIPTSPLVVELVEMIGAGMTTREIASSAVFALVVFFLPAIVGYRVGHLVRRARAGVQGTLASWIRAYVPPRLTAWDRAWAPALQSSRALVQLHLDDSETVVGQFADLSQVDLSPLPPQVYLEQTLIKPEVGGEGQVLPGPPVHVDGKRIRFVEIQPLG